MTDTDGREDMKRIFGITAVEERVKPGKAVKVNNFTSFIFTFYKIEYKLSNLFACTIHFKQEVLTSYHKFMTN